MKSFRFGLEFVIVVVIIINLLMNASKDYFFYLFNIIYYVLSARHCAGEIESVEVQAV